ncbi:DUF2784 domain-containing protein [Actinophytocola sp.]|uniref:DUF2784 domain-containing protein n=1 Tax=Actinophytocola sp. TaxID=1872138 RepID=UPI002D3B4961|nr:DUF2784 domain-containing protein [Actinophytocola sp.]HYQ64360.1 DUF2784 domain-containing protein [Actinophytocola sp.]
MAWLLADVTVVVHFIALLYIGLGGFLAWRWHRAIFVHVFFAAWGVIVNVTPIQCPLTALENWFRGMQGLGPLPGGFNEYYIYGEIIPRALLPVVGAGAVAVVVASYVGVWKRWPRSPVQPSGSSASPSV